MNKIDILNWDGVTLPETSEEMVELLRQLLTITETLKVKLAELGRGLDSLERRIDRLEQENARLRYMNTTAEWADLMAFVQMRKGTDLPS
ncbi:MAG: hypothetical protein K6B45_01845 [Bacteroidaceae bacterium]|nr:hypothetical protein [Bacteroidaceae bacterium]